jgi:TonB-linked SusC/RagA family outer membrane protein
MKLRLQRIGLLLCLSLLSHGLSAIAQTTITGTVTNKTDKQPIPGASIQVKGTNSGTQTDGSGKFSINIKNTSGTLVVSAVGFETAEITTAGKSVVNFSLSPSSTNLNEVVVTGYSSQRKKDITGAVSVVKVADLQSVPATSTENQLQGRASGVTVITNSQPGSVSAVRIRGLASFTGNDPLYIVDGIPNSSLSAINPDDVESMQVLKDASAASIYGSRASNGVIIITTKKGRAGSTKLSYNMYYGIQDPGKGYTDNMLNPQEYANLQWMAYKNSGQSSPSAQYGSGPTPVLPDYILAGTQSGVKEGDPAASPALYDLNYANLGDPNYTPYLIVKANKQGTNWWKELTRVAPIMNHNITLSGGTTDKSRFLASFNYFNQDGIVKENFYKRYSARVNTEFNIKNNLRIGENLQLLFSEGNSAPNNNESSEIVIGRNILPIIPVYTIKGDFAGTKGSELGNADNVVALRDRAKNNRNNNFSIFGNIYAELDILNHFTLRSSFGGNYGTYDSKAYPFLEYEGAENNRNPTFSRTFGKSRSWTWTNQLSYKNIVGNHNIQAIIGTEAVEETGDQVTGSRSNYFSYTNNDFITLSSGTSNQLVSGAPIVNSSLFSLFGKADYIFKDKYLAGATVRRDGSSRFGASTRYGVFPAASLGWRISKEAFMQPVQWISDLKIRGSYGTMGNQRIPSANQFTQFATRPSASSYDIYGTSTSPESGFYLSFVGNTQGQWETNTTSNIGFDASLFKNTEISFDWYQKKTKNLLFPVEQLATSGGIASQNPPFFNVGSMKNRGVDLAVSQRTTISKVKIDATLTFTTYHNEITSIAKDVSFFDYNSPLNEQNRIGGVFTRNAIGRPINSYYGYKVIGLFQSTEDVTKSPAQPDAAPGRFKYADTNGDATIDENDRTFFGNPNPDFTSGLNLNFSYKNFDLSTFFYGVAGKDAINYARYSTDFYGVTNKRKEALYNSWTPQNPNAKLPIQETVATFSSNAVPNSYAKENASYLRLRNLSLGYNLSPSVLNRLKIDRFRIYVQIINLFTITKYTGLDPEIISTDDRAAGIDAGVYPAVKQFLVGANLNF